MADICYDICDNVDRTGPTGLKEIEYVISSAEGSSGKVGIWWTSAMVSGNKPVCDQRCWWFRRKGCNMTDIGYDICFNVDLAGSK
jgi:hypothetical protein